MTELDEFRSYLQYDCRKSPNTVASYSSDVKSFLKWLSEQGRDATEAESADFEVYVKEHGFVSPRSQSRALSAIRSFSAFGHFIDLSVNQFDHHFHRGLPM